MIKNIFIISSILLLLVLVFFGIYNFAFKGITSIRNLSEEAKDDSIVKKTEEKKIFALSDKPALGAALDSNGSKIRFYNKDNGDVVEVTLDGSIEKVIFENDLKNLLDVKWSPNKNFVISSFGGNTSKKFYLYSYITRRSVELKDGIDQVIWDNQGEKIIYKYFDKNSGERSLNVSNPNGSNWRMLTTLGDEFKKMEFSHVPQTLFVSFWNYPDVNQESFLEKINLLESGKKEEIMRGRFGANYLWSPNGRKILVSSYDKASNKLKLEAGEATKESLSDLGVPTMVDKCVWANNNNEIFCAMPLDIPEGSVLPNDYQEEKILTKDAFWRINVETGKKDRIIELGELGNNFDASDLFLSSKEDILFFINRHDDRLYGLVL